MSHVFTGLLTVGLIMGNDITQNIAAEAATLKRTGQQGRTGPSGVA